MTSPKHTYKRPCHDCDELFQPNGKYQKYCEGCKKVRHAIAIQKRSQND